MDRLKEMVNKTLADENSAGDEYGQMIEATKESKLDNDTKGLITSMLSKIQADEKTHHQMLLVIQEVLNDETQ